jgi:hypothetical protein
LLATSWRGSAHSDPLILCALRLSLFDVIKKMANRRTGFSRPVIARMGQKVRLLIFGGFAPSEAVLNRFEPHGLNWRGSPRR